MAIMDEGVWRGKVYSGGWTSGAGGEAAVIEPATGEEIGRTGIGGPEDVARAAQIAAAAQPAWAATPHTERSAILRRAADIWLANAAEIEWWGIRESGKIPPAMQFETHVATQEIYEAATLPSRAYGELLPSEQPRLSFAERVPAEDAAKLAAKLAAESEYGLSLGILTRDVMRGLDLARRIPTGIVHSNEQTVDDEPNIPFGGIGASGTGARFGGPLTWRRSRIHAG